MIYTIAGGTGKRRMNADATIRDGYAWSTFAVLSGECSLEEKVRSDGGAWLAGMAVRIVDVDVSEVNRTSMPRPCSALLGSKIITAMPVRCSYRSWLSMACTGRSTDFASGF